MAVWALAPALAGTALASAALAATPLANESVATFEGQLNRHQVRVVSLQTNAHTLHVALKDGRKMRVAFPSSEQRRLVGQVESRGVRVKVSKVKSPPAKTRYIVGGVAIVAIAAVVAGLLLFMRRRRLREEEEGPRASARA
jgi:ATP-dependent Zn protease